MPFLLELLKVLLAVVTLFASIVVLRQYHAQRRYRSYKLPPGPSSRGTSLIPKTHPWRRLKEYSDEYGELITVPMSNGKFLFVCATATSASALLNKESGSTSDRPRQIMAGDLMSGGKRMLILGYNDRWRMYRKIFHEALNNVAAAEYESIQENEAVLTASHIGQQPDRFQDHFGRYAASTIMTIAYDHPVRSLDDPLVKEVQQCLGNLGRWISPGASPLDTYPLLRFVPSPINPWKRLGNKLHEQELRLFLDVYHDVRQRSRQGMARPCFASKLQERQEELGLSDEEACYVAGSLFGAGSDTTQSALAIFIMAMIKHPNVVEKAQLELDRVLGFAVRLPTFSDLDDLPYLRALCQEIHRWRPVSSGGFQHAITKDLRYKQYVLPKGNAIVGNHWSIHLDPNEYPEPDVFKPERFLDDDGVTVKGTWFSTSGHVQFGFGRRICVGHNVAERSILINSAILLWAFNIRAPDARPDKVDTLAFNSAANSHPLPFKADITYRSDQHRTLVEEARATLLAVD